MIYKNFERSTMHEETILREFPWLTETNDNAMDDLESKARINTSRHISPDMIALSSVCALLCIILVIFGKCFKNENNHYPPVPNVSIPTNLSMAYAQCPERIMNSRIIEPLHAGGDMLFSQEIRQSNDLFQSTVMKLKQSDISNFPDSSNSTGDSNFPVATTQSNHSQHSQSTQTNPRILKKASKTQGWLVRRTRSGLIYGKYPL